MADDTPPKPDDGGTETSDDGEQAWGRLGTMLADATKPFGERLDKIEAALAAKPKGEGKVKDDGTQSDGTGGKHTGDGHGHPEPPRRRRLLDIL